MDPGHGPKLPRTEYSGGWKTGPNYTTLNYTTLHYTTLYNTIIHYTIL